MNVLPLLSALIGLGAALALMPVLLRVCRKTGVLVRSGDLHHGHAGAIPRIGGLALALAFVAVECFIAWVAPTHRSDVPNRMGVIGSCLAMFCLGFWDDLRPVGAKRKLLIQVLISASVLFWGIGIQQFKIPFDGTIINLGPWGGILTVLWLVGMTNLINLIDGIDGLAGGISLMLMLLLAWVGFQSGHFALLSAGMTGALLGFLWFNFPPARVYLGDGGAYFLGFQIGLFSLINSQKGTVIAALVAPMFVLALPILDTSLAILRRGVRGLPVFRPDRRHLHHHLISMGLSRRRVVLSFYAVTLVFLGMGFLAYSSRGNLVPVLLGLSGVILLVLAGKLRFSREWFALGRMIEDSFGIRQQVRYAMSLTRWLELEGTRHRAVDPLWNDFIFAARKLGFTSVQLTLANDTRTWTHPALPDSQGGLVANYRLQDGLHGTLEVRAQACPNRITAECGFCRNEHAPDSRACPCVWNPRVFEIVSELLAEGWTRAASNLAKNCREPLKFGQASPFVVSPPSQEPWTGPRWPVAPDTEGGRP